MKTNNNATTIIFIVFITISLLVLGYFVKDYLEYENEKNIQKKLDRKLEVLFEKIQERKKIIQTASLLLSQNDKVKDCLKNVEMCLIDDEDTPCILYIKHIQEEFKKVNYLSDLGIHIHTKDFKSFFRAWSDDYNSFDDLSSFRTSLSKAKNDKNIVLGEEIGKYSLKLRAISPLYDGKKYLGSVEVLSSFDDITNYYKNIGIDFFVLMNKDKEKISTSVKYKNDKNFNDYIIINNVNSNLKGFEKHTLKNNTSYISENCFYLLYTPIYNISREQIGYYALKIPKDKLF